MESQIPICFERLPISMIEWLHLFRPHQGNGRTPCLCFTPSCFMFPPTSSDRSVRVKLRQGAQRPLPSQ
eukprot:8292566-Pyramimonas_sp.AAC.1